LSASEYGVKNFTVVCYITEKEDLLLNVTTLKILDDCNTQPIFVF